MRVLHLPNSCLPWVTGGKEVYCHTLATALRNMGGFESVVAVHEDQRSGTLRGKSSHKGIPVYVLPRLTLDNQRRNSYERTYSAVPEFREFLEQIRPDVVHFHDQNGGASLSHLRIVKDMRLPAVITFHTPGQTCPQRSLLRYGTIPCDGRVTKFRCTVCRLRVSGAPRGVAEAVSLFSVPGINPWSDRRLNRLLTGRVMTSLHMASQKEFFDLADIVVALAKWAEQVLLRNDLPQEKCRLVPSGGRTRHENRPSIRQRERPGNQTLRVACMGRCDWVKGFHVLVDAVKLLPREDLEIHFFGPGWTSEYGRQLLGSMRNDDRFRDPQLVPNSQLSEAISDMDVIVIPSLWLETGPLTLFDAFSVGVPVIGSRLGGIAERVRDGIDGLLFEPGNPRALARCLRSLASDTQLLGRLRADSPQVRTMADVASEMSAVYHELA